MQFFRKEMVLLSFESFIIAVALIAAAAGSLVLLTALAGKRARLIKAYNLQQEIEARERQIAATPDQKTATPPLPAN